MNAIPKIIEHIAIGELIPYARNARTHSDEQIAQIAASIDEFGWTNPVLINAENGIIAGHGRVLAAELRQIDQIPCIRLDHLTPEQERALILTDNKLGLNAGWDADLLKAELAALQDLDFDVGIIGFSDQEIDELFAEIGAPAGKKAGSLTDEFLIAPFTVLNAREGWWQDRKRGWLALGIQSEVGRGENLLKMSDTMLEPDPVKRAAMIAEREHREPSGESTYLKGSANLEITTDPYRKRSDTRATKTQSWVQQKIEAGDIEGGMAAGQSGTSIFDPVLCELAYRWFSPQGGQILDPFAGGSVRGIVAGKLGRAYRGIDLRAEQVEANRAQAAKILGPEDGEVEWICGDSKIELSGADEFADFVFSCPPYGDLEVYSDDPADLSTMDHAEFLAIYRSIIQRSIGALHDDRFACFVVGDYRDPKGFYRNFVSETIAAFESGGAKLYNEAILVTSAGSLPIRAAKQFRTTRKLGKTHQNILVFCKGDPRRATEACGPVDVTDAIEAFEAAEDQGGVEPGSEFGEIL